MNAKTKTSDSHPNSVPGLTADPARQDVWFALRTDGVTGTGSESDPFDVSMRAEIPLPISSLTFTGREATVNTRAPRSEERRVGKSGDRGGVRDTSEIG